MRSMNFVRRAQNFFVSWLPVPTRPMEIQLKDVTLPVMPTREFSSFWKMAASGNWEPETFATLDQYVKPERLFVDMGAWIGPTVLYAAARRANVVTFEPDDRALRELRANLALNAELSRRVNVQPYAVSDRDASAVLRSSKLGNSESSIVTATKRRPSGSRVTLGDEQACEVRAVSRVTNEIDIAAATLIKIDIEGAEYDLLPALVPHLVGSKAVIYLSFHPHNLPDEQASLRSLEVLSVLEGYQPLVPTKHGAFPTSMAALREHAAKPAGLGGSFVFEPKRPS